VRTSFGRRHVTGGGAPIDQAVRRYRVCEHRRVSDADSELIRLDPESEACFAPMVKIIADEIRAPNFGERRGTQRSDMAITRRYSRRGRCDGPLHGSTATRRRTALPIR
jgi:hypothetical protein